MKLYLVRHAQSESNFKGLNAGQTDCQLTEKGIEQAKKAGERLKDESIDVIFVSDLKRTMQTAEEIITYHPDVEVIYEPRIRERHMGIYDGTAYGSMREECKRQNIDYVDFKPENGESVIELRKRINDFLDWLIDQYVDKSVLLVTHGGIIVNMILKILDVPDEEFYKYLPNNTAITVIEIKEDKSFEIHQMNCDKHLE